MYDNKGHALFEENNLGNVSKDAFVSIVDGGITSEEIWQALLDAEYLQAVTIHTALTFLTSKFQPTQGFQLQLPEKFAPFLRDYQAIKTKSAYGLLSNRYSREDKTSIDPRLYYSNVNEDKAYYNFKYRYAMDAKNLSLPRCGCG